jgi:hypothetical protein
VRPRKGQTGLIVALRLDETNKSVVDYLIFPAEKVTSPWLQFSEGNERGAARVETARDLVALVKRRVKRAR